MKIEKNEKIFIAMIVLIIVVLVGAYYLIPYIVKDGLPSSLGLFGDQFGAVNALFSGLAFAGLIYTILLQKEELKAQREELRYTRDEIEGQKLELRQQNETLTLQRFETSFFNMLSQHNEMVSRLSVMLGGKDYLGKWVISEFSRLFHMRLNDYYVQLPQEERQMRVAQRANDVFLEIIRNEIKNTGFYFRSLSKIFSFLDEMNFSWNEKNKYAEVVLSQLNDQEVELMFLYGLTTEGQRFKGVIEKLSLLRDIRLNDGTFYNDFNKNFLYRESAFNINVER